MIKNNDINVILDINCKWKNYKKDVGNYYKISFLN